MTMKKAPIPEMNMNDELRPEYAFDYREARPNCFAATSNDSVVVVLDPDVARVFTTPEAVNNILRALIQHMPDQEKSAA